MVSLGLVQAVAAVAVHSRWLPRAEATITELLASTESSLQQLSEQPVAVCNALQDLASIADSTKLGSLVLALLLRIGLTDPAVWSVLEQMSDRGCTDEWNAVAARMLAIHPPPPLVAVATLRRAEQVPRRCLHVLAACMCLLLAAAYMCLLLAAGYICLLLAAT